MKAAPNLTPHLYICTVLVWTGHPHNRAQPAQHGWCNHWKSQGWLAYEAEYKQTHWLADLNKQIQPYLWTTGSDKHCMCTQWEPHLSPLILCVPDTSLYACMATLEDCLLRAYKTADSSYVFQVHIHSLQSWRQVANVIRNQIHMSEKHNWAPQALGHSIHVPMA